MLRVGVYCVLRNNTLFTTTAILIQSDSSHLPIWAVPSILAKNSSIGTVGSKPEYFVSRETNDTSLWIVGVLMDRHYLNRRITSLDSSNSSILKLKVRINYISKRSGFNSGLVRTQFLNQ